MPCLLLCCVYVCKLLCCVYFCTVFIYLHILFTLIIHAKLNIKNIEYPIPELHMSRYPILFFKLSVNGNCRSGAVRRGAAASWRRSISGAENRRAAPHCYQLPCTTDVIVVVTYIVCGICPVCLFVIKRNVLRSTKTTARQKEQKIMCGNSAIHKDSYTVCTMCRVKG